MAENLATIDYKTNEEVLHVIYWINRILSVVAISVLHSIQAHEKTLMVADKAEAVVDTETTNVPGPILETLPQNGNFSEIGNTAVITNNMDGAMSSNNIVSMDNHVDINAASDNMNDSIQFVFDSNMGDFGITTEDVRRDLLLPSATVETMHNGNDLNTATKSYVNDHRDFKPNEKKAEEIKSEEDGEQKYNADISVAKQEIGLLQLNRVDSTMNWLSIVFNTVIYCK